MNPVIQICVLVLFSPMDVLSPLFGASSSNAVPFEDITEYLRPVGDGHVSKIILERDKIFLMRSYPGESTPNAELIEIVRGKPVLRKSLFEIGIDSSLSKNNKVYHQNPELVAKVGDGLFLLNLLCGSEFPVYGTSQAHRGATGNVILFNRNANTFTNLTKLDGQTGKYARAVRWFPEHGAILVLEYEREDKIVPAPTETVKKAICLKLSDFSEHSVNRFEDIAKWYRIYSGLRVRIHRSLEQEESIKWTILNGDNVNAVVFDVKDDGRTMSGLRVFPFSPYLACVGNEKIGTYLIDYGGFIRNRISMHEAFDYDNENRILFLQSSSRDENGERRYWVLDMNVYISSVITRLR